MTTKVVDFLNESGGSNFTETAPRPPPCGEENELQSNGGNSTKSSGSHKSHVSSKSHSSSRSGTSTKGGDHSHSPATTPRKSNLQQDTCASTVGKSISSSSGGNANVAADSSISGGQDAISCEDSEEVAPLGFEPEGSAANSPPYSENGTPPHLKWAENLGYLLDDSEGVELFKDFMEHEWEGGSEELQFWFACQGLKRKLGSGSLDGNIIDIQKAIYKRYVRSDKVKCISKDVKKEIAQKLSNKSAIDGCIFNAAQEEVEDSMRNVTYPAFLRSDYYVQYVQNYGDSPKSSQSSGSNSARPVSQSGLLPVLHEDKELENNDFTTPLAPLPVISKPAPAKRPEVLSASRRTETVTGSSLYVSKGSSVSYPAHVSYAPVSAQDSELQSLSSDALTDDTISVTDSSVDGYPHHLRKKHHRKAMMKSLAQQNREFRTGLHSQIIPRTEHAPKDRNVAETDPKRFSDLLIEKLNKVLEERESSAKVEEKLRSIAEPDRSEGPTEKLASIGKPNISSSTASNHLSSGSHNTSSNAAHNTSSAHNTSASFIPLMRPPSGLEEETAESILDQHCSRIWASSSHHTPSYSPPGGHHSPPPLPGKAETRKKLIAAAANTSTSSASAFSSGVFSGGQSLSFGPSPRSYHHKKRGASAGAVEFLAQSSSSQSFDSGLLEERSLILLGTETHRHIHHHHHHHHSGSSSSKKGSGLVEVEAHSHAWRTTGSAADMQPQNLSSDFAMPEYAGRGRTSARKSGLGGGGGGGGGSSSIALRKASDTSSNIDSGISVMFDKDSVRVPPNWSSNPANEKVMKWILDSETVQDVSSTVQDGDRSSSSHKRSHRLNQSSSAAQTPKQSHKSKGFGRSASVERSGGSSGIGSNTLGIFSGGSNNNSGNDRHLLSSWASGGAGHHHPSSLLLPSQPFAQDPSMPLLTPPNPTTQLEEAKRRLETQQQQGSVGQTGTTSVSGLPSSQARGAVLGGCSSSSGASAPVKSKSFTGVLSKDKVRAHPSGTPLAPPHSRTLPTTRTVPTDLDTSSVSQTIDSRLGRRGPANSSSSAPTSVQPSPGDTIIGIYMGQEPIPYRHQLPGRAITLAQIRTLVTKRGPFKYYFKRHSDEFGDGAGAVFEEISDESAVVPMFQGKIVVKVEKLDL
ncbi:axin-1 [Plakobranchus ocellatus]|uniref:Axin-1 n=1 Tax=Plakobranchus ocellatus TaxID=259542 RepID=A0AAV3YHP8_9GAST|nr:axin-1 [Plakobranchus ocellatus]